PDNGADGGSDTHSHTLTIAEADIIAGLEAAYTSAGGTHNHVATVSAKEMVALRDNCAVTVDSADTHPHTWTIAVVQ
ncbi:MAG: hypothetical protein HN348_23140, partial [Proteobacteria bacterium]|nr:hypothetical protein [Pseudomonadota bacterium]